MLKGSFASTLFTVIVLVTGLALVGCTDVVPQVAMLREIPTVSNKVIFDSFVPAQNPTNSVDDISITAYGSGFSAYKMTLESSLQNCANADFSKATENTSGNFTFPAPSEGSWVVCALARVAATGTWQDASEASTSKILQVDRTAPENNSLVINHDIGWTTGVSVQVDLTSTGASEVYITQTDDTCSTGGTWETFTQSKQITLQHENAMNTVYAKFRDAALNETDCMARNILHDNIPPMIPMVTSPPAGTVYNAATTSTVINFSCESGSTLTLQDGSASWDFSCANSVAAYTLDLTKYSNGGVLTIFAKDQVGNVSSNIQYNFIRDTVPPDAVVVTSPANNSYINAAKLPSMLFSGTCESGATVYFSGQSTTCVNSAWSLSVSVSSFAEGTVTLNAYQVDAAGNTGPTTTTTLIKDTIAPASIGSLTFASSWINSYNQSAFNLSGTCETGATITYKFGSFVGTLSCSGGAFNNYVDLTSLPEGNLAFEIYQTDPAGNQSTSTSTGLNKDTIAPTIVATGLPAANSISNLNSINIAVNAGDAVYYSYKLGPAGSTVCNNASGYGAWIAVGTTTPVSLGSDGKITLCVVGKDNAGNIDYTKSVSSTWWKDTVLSTLRFESVEQTVNTGAGVQYVNVILTPAKAYPVSFLMDVGGDTIYNVDHGYSSSAIQTINAGTTSSLIGVNILQNNSRTGLGLLSFVLNGSPFPSGGLLQIDPSFDSSSMLIRYAGTQPVVSSIAAGGQHTCAVLNTGALKCWGANDFNQSTTTTEKITAVATAPIAANFSKVTAGQKHTCGITTGGVAYCWGSNESGQLGSTNLSNTQVAVDSGTILYSSISAGPSATCGITTAGILRCWGLISSVVAPAVLDSGTNYSSVSVGANHICGITTSNILKCMGTNDKGQLGNGSTVNSSTFVTIDGGIAYSAVAAGNGFTCGIVANSKYLKCWGQNDYGQVGNNSTANVTTPTVIDGSNPYLSVFVGPNFACGLTNSNNLKCWGSNSDGQFGDGTVDKKIIPTQVNSNTYAAGSAGGAHVCMVTATGELSCAGSNSSAQMGNINWTYKRAPTSVLGTMTYTSITSGFGHMCALNTSNSAMSCSGYNTFGQFGNNDSVSVAGLQYVQKTSAYSSIASGQFHMCGILTSSGQLRCWGKNDSGQVSLDPTTYPQMLSPTIVDSGVSYSQVRPGFNHTCAITSSNIVRCWGNNIYGAVGNGGSGANVITPTSVSDGNTYKSVSAGYLFSCGVTTSGILKCWGDSADGKLGNNDNGTSDSYVPLQIDTADTFIKVSSGLRSSCAITSNNYLKCWGANDSGQLGTGDNTGRIVPTYVDGSTKYNYIAMGTTHSCGITTAGALKCWGGNTSGQLGNGALTGSSSPIVVDGANVYIDVTVGNDFSCGLLQNGKINCWGGNRYGQTANVRDSSFWHVFVNALRTLAQ
ncbi:hypothetical protein [Bdellovibrio sp. NC01]|uniref:RCC1 domain-containing protein n=1 Tax=Bdellovibrio sp. NC01 TaxID=2220073 RepID=UPI00115AAC5C|nr:hypothetical protein [Bdellovibrio sp. NC01]QDK38986.1 hypothetical protein DOE51_16025 [Bdellovibrio sp. NC01]